MKRLLVLILALTLLLFSCDVTEQNSVSEPDLSETEQEISDFESSNTENSEVSEVKDHPIVTGTFIQLWAFSGYSVTQWENHFNKLMEVGIDTVIVQWTATTPYGEFKDAYYGTELAEGNSTSDYVCYSNCIYRMFEAAKYTGTKIYLGLNISDEWWNYSNLDTAWGVTQAELGLQIARELYDKYYKAYTENFAGWYWAWELYNAMSDEMATSAGQFINLYLEGLTQIDPSLPLMLSPFITEGLAVDKTEAIWDVFFETANFREGDIYCCQDSVGAGHIKIDKLDAYYAAIAAAVAREDGLIFWANNENFTPSYTPAEMERFVEQMEITDKYVSGHVTFAYSHYYHPEKYPQLHEEYKNYYETGNLG